MTIIDAINKAKEAKAAIEEGNILTGWEHTLEIQQFLIDTGRGFGITADEQEEFDKDDVKNLEKALKECSKALKPALLKSCEDETEVMKIGDGNLLKRLKELIDIIVVLLPIFLKK